MSGAVVQLSISTTCWALRDASTIHENITALDTLAEDRGVGPM